MKVIYLAQNHLLGAKFGDDPLLGLQTIQTTERHSVHFGW